MTNGRRKRRQRDRGGKRLVIRTARLTDAEDATLADLSARLKLSPSAVLRKGLAAVAEGEKTEEPV